MEWGQACNVARASVACAPSLSVVGSWPWSTSGAAHTLKSLRLLLRISGPSMIFARRFSSTNTLREVSSATTGGVRSWR